MTHEYSAHSRHEWCRLCKRTRAEHDNVDFQLFQDIARTTLSFGGGTWSARTLATHAPTEGYAVGLGNGSKVVVATVNGETSTDERNRIAVAVYRAVQAHPTAPYVGTWCDDGIVYIDPVVIIQSRDDAVTLGRAIGEKAIYSFATADSVEC